MVAPLDWGLGHATRCIPLIRELESNNCKVIVAADAAILSLLQHEFQHLIFIPLAGYRISYSKKKSWLPLVLIAQLPVLLRNIYKEHRWLKKVVKDYGIDAILSDNRFGLYHATLPSVYITHQLLIKTGNHITEDIGQKIHAWFIRKYSVCWVPDLEGGKNIAGALSHPLRPPSNVKYIGCLSRFAKKEGLLIKYQLLILISGPEPQRSIFETLVLAELKNYSGRVLLVRGLPGKPADDFSIPPVYGNLVIKNHLDAVQLNEVMQQADIVISRSGYTTIMDLVKLQQKAILVPTPGQTEQEYLANHLMEQHIFLSVPQNGFHLPDALRQAATFPFRIPAFDMDQYKKIVRQFAQSL